MRYAWRICSGIVIAVFLGFYLCSCGDSPTRFNPGIPAESSGLATTATGNGQVGLSWPAVDGATSYNIYYSTSPGITTGSGTKLATSSTSAIVPGLTNNTTYYFVITSVSASGESSVSNEVSAKPAVPGAVSLADLLGTWNFNILVSGTGAGWMRGKVQITDDGSGAGAVNYLSFLDSSNNTTPTSGLFNSLYWDAATGRVRDKSGNFQGYITSNLYRDMIVLTSSLNAGSRLVAILQKQVSGIKFSNSGDIKGFGNLAGGARRFVYNQISSGALQEWEYAVGQIGQDLAIQYSTFTAPSSPVTPGKKASSFSISADGIVTETLGGATPAPAVVIPAGVMSADKSVIVATATDTSGSSPRYILRIYQVINALPSDPNTFSLADLAGSYKLQQLVIGTSTLWATGLMTVDASGAAAFSTFTDSNGGSAAPAAINLAVDGSGVLTNAADTTFHGKLSYYKYMQVFTRTEAAGTYSLSVALK